MQEGDILTITVTKADYIPYQAEVALSSCLGTRFVRGDSNGDGAIDIADAIAVLSYLFAGGRALDCDDAADVNDDVVGTDADNRP